MSFRSRGVQLGVAAVAATAIAAFSAGTPAASAADQAHAHRAGHVIGSAARPVDKAAVLAYWTLARLRAAKPLDVITAGARPPAHPVVLHPTGKAGHITGGAPHVHTRVPVLPSHVRPADYPFPYDSFNVPVSDYTSYPFSMNGRLFFTNNGAGYSCSATSVGSHNGTGNENEIWTAGHCLVNTEAGNQVVDSSAVFIPAYNGNSSNFDPFGEFVWDGGWETTTAWYYNRDLSEDEAAMEVGNSTSNGQTLGWNVGWDGFAWNEPVSEFFTAFGYPAGSPYDGTSMVIDFASTGGQDGNFGANPVAPIAIGNPMTGGSSGGAWNIGWSTSGSGWINGHNDYKYGSQPLAMYSPYQDSLSNVVRCFGASSC
ncbi:MAG TPA: hypothetical protein VGS19_16880 [Streptosporangiaceae bacterium]|nr:hypothetical protein [Streptosporangiaceae bacterium]